MAKESYSSFFVEKDHLAVLAERQADFISRYSLLFRLLEQVDSTLFLIARLLNVSQPPSNGKIGIVWWKPNGGSVLRVPVFVLWRRHKGTGKMFPEVIKRNVQRRQRVIGPFARNKTDTTKLLALAVELVAKRALLLRLTGRTASEASRFITMNAVNIGAIELVLNTIKSSLSLSNNVPEKDLFNGTDRDDGSRDPDSFMDLFANEMVGCASDSNDLDF